MTNLEKLQHLSRERHVIQPLRKTAKKYKKKGPRKINIESYFHLTQPTPAQIERAAKRAAASRKRKLKRAFIETLELRGLLEIVPLARYKMELNRPKPTVNAPVKIVFEQPKKKKIQEEEPERIERVKVVRPPARYSNRNPIDNLLLDL